MKKHILLLILLLAAAAASASAEEKKLTVASPIGIRRYTKGVVGETIFSAAATPDVNIPPSSLIVEGDSDINGLTIGRGSGNIATNTALGSFALLKNSTGAYNTAAGYWALAKNTAGSYNTALGYQALWSNYTGSNNTAIGSGSLYNTGVGSTSLGAFALFNNVGADNTAVGSRALFSTYTGANNTAAGSSALDHNTIGSNNTVVGEYALGMNSSASAYEGNVAIGRGSANMVEAANNKLYIDVYHFTPPEILVEGDFALNTVKINGPLTTTIGCTSSDRRWKKNIRSIDNALTRLLKLRGVTYEWDIEKYPGMGFGPGEKIGMIAQEVEGVFPQLVATDPKGYKTLEYEKIAPILIEAIKEQQARIEEQRLQISLLKAELNLLKELVKKKTAKK
ncbi:MAG: tail fiber domain-containing protein [Candidatus Omnitrophica bacterium]|nr:tail fiber domain-containing protein [Candidatus Omnitrophota bacterium]